MTVLQRLEAFRELIRHGNSLLGEVVAYCKEAEAAVAQLAADKQDIDRVRGELEEARSRADAEGEAARKAMAQVQQQSQELSAMREELVAARSEVDAFQRTQNENASALERSLEESREQQKRLEEELARVRSQSRPMPSLDLEAMQTKMRTTEALLEQTRRDLANERARRDRAVALIKPKAVADETAGQAEGTQPPARSLKP